MVGGGGVPVGGDNGFVVTFGHLKLVLVCLFLGDEGVQASPCILGVFGQLDQGSFCFARNSSYKQARCFRWAGGPGMG